MALYLVSFHILLHQYYTKKKKIRLKKNSIDFQSYENDTKVMHVQD